MEKRLILPGGVQCSTIELQLQTRSGGAQSWQTPVLARCLLPLDCQGSGGEVARPVEGAVAVVVVAQLAPADEEEDASRASSRAALSSQPSRLLEAWIERQTPRVSITIRRTALAKRRLGRSELKPLSDWSDDRLQTELNSKLYRQAQTRSSASPRKRSPYCRGCSSAAQSPRRLEGIDSLRCAGSA